MDAVTHGLLGAVVAQLGFRQRLGREATWVAAAAALVPDVDVVTEFLVSPARSMSFAHRGVTHSLLCIPLLALAATFLWQRGRPKLQTRLSRGHGLAEQGNSSSFWLWYFCIWTAMVSHSLLDLCTGYGTQLFAPVISSRYAPDAVGIFDLPYSALLVLTLLACGIARRMKGDSRTLTVVIGGLGLAFSTAYLSVKPVRHFWHCYRYGHRINKGESQSMPRPLPGLEPIHRND